MSAQPTNSIAEAMEKICGDLGTPDGKGATLLGIGDHVIDLATISPERLDKMFSTDRCPHCTDLNPSD